MHSCKLIQITIILLQLLIGYTPSFHRIVIYCCRQSLKQALYKTYVSSAEGCIWMDRLILSYHSQRQVCDFYEILSEPLYCFRVWKRYEFQITFILLMSNVWPVMGTMWGVCTNNSSLGMVVELVKYVWIYVWENLSYSFLRTRKKVWYWK